MDEVSIFSEYIDKKVVIKIQENSFCTGICRSIDGYLNIILEAAEFHETEEAETKKLTTCLIRGTVIKHLQIIQ